MGRSRKRSFFVVLSISFLSALSCSTTPKAVVEANNHVGITTADYYIKKYFDDYFPGVDMLEDFRSKGVGWIRVGITTSVNPELEIGSWAQHAWKDSYWSSREVAARTFKRARELGMKINAFLFLSDQAAHSERQKRPKAWKSLSEKELLSRVEEYCYETALYFQKKGIDVQVYEIGNEIERGLLGYFPGDGVSVPEGVNPRHDVLFMRQSIWRPEVNLLKSAIKGVRRASPESLILLHSSSVGAFSNFIVTEFFSFLSKANVDYDIIGLTYPYQHERNPIAKPYFRSSEFADLIAVLKKYGKPIVISEFRYPHSARHRRSSPDPGYPYTEEGQALWTRHFLDTVLLSLGIDRAFWFYADYFDGLSSNPYDNTAGLYDHSYRLLKAADCFNPNLER